MGWFTLYGHIWTIISSNVFTIQSSSRALCTNCMADRLLISISKNPMDHIPDNITQCHM